MKIIIDNFRLHLRKCCLAKNTIKAYTFSAYTFLNIYKKVDAKNVMAFQTYLEANYTPKSANLHIVGFNRFLRFIGKSDLRLHEIKLQNTIYRDKIISYKEYLGFKRHLFSMNDKKWFFIVWTLAATGVRISELVQFQREDIDRGFIDVRSKGNKIRRVFIPKRLQKGIIAWLDKSEITDGAVFRSRKGKQISIRGITKGLESAAIKAGIDPHLVHPHGFRHLFAKKFLEQNGDLATLADLLGHESLDTTKIYLRRTTQEQKDLVDKIVEW